MKEYYDTDEYEVRVFKKGKEQELKDIRCLTDPEELARAKRIMAARKKLEKELNFDEDD